MRRGRGCKSDVEEVTGAVGVELRQTSGVLPGRQIRPADSAGRQTHAGAVHTACATK